MRKFESMLDNEHQVTTRPLGINIKQELTDFEIKKPTKKVG